MSNKQQFIATILQAPEYKNAAYIIIPFDVEKVYGKKRVKIKATFDGHPYQGSLVRMGKPHHILIVRKDIRAAIGKSFGDEVDITVEEDTAPRVVEVPQDFQKAIQANKKVKAFFETLSYTNQKEFVQWICSAKRETTRTNRIQKAIALMADGKKTR